MDAGEGGRELLVLVDDELTQREDVHALACHTVAPGREDDGGLHDREAEYHVGLTRRMVCIGHGMRPTAVCARLTYGDSGSARSRARGST
jgi:hypothetical protein